MAAKKPADRTRQLSPIRVAPLEPLNACTVHEHELDIIAAGSQATLAVNFAIASISLGVGFILTLTTTRIDSDRRFFGYVIACINCVLAGVVMFIYWLRTRVSVNVTVARIKARLIVELAIQDPIPTDLMGPPPP